MIQTILNGIDSESYNKLGPELRALNRRNVILFSFVTAILLTVLDIVSYFGKVISYAQIIYTIFTCCFICLALVSIFVAKKFPLIINPCSILCIILLFLFSISMSFFDSPESTSTIFMVLVFVVPLLFNFKPKVTDCLIITATIIFIFAESKCKTKDVFIVDCVNALCFSILSIIVGTYMMIIKLQRLKIGINLQIAAEKKLEQSVTELNQNLEILSSISGIYNSMYLIDLEKDLVNELKSNDRIRRYANKKNTAAEKMQHALENLSNEEHKKGILLFTDLSTIKERMQNKKYAFHDFLTTVSGWMRATFIVNKTDSNGYPTQVIFATLLIDEYKKREETLYKISTIDELTHIYNRRSYEEDLEKLEKESLPDDLVIFAFDVNQLKATNDNLGHAAGDELICGSAECMQKIFSPYGKVYRTGGDEFMAIINVNSSEVPELHKAFSNTVAEWKGKLVSSLKVACGYAVKKDNPELSLFDLAKIADLNMYKDKKAFYVSTGLDRRQN